MDCDLGSINQINSFLPQVSFGLGIYQSNRMKPEQKCSNYSMHYAAVPHLIGELFEGPDDTWDHAQTGCTIQMLALKVWFIQDVEVAQSANCLP